jgi:hypothetical protein
LIKEIYLTYVGLIDAHQRKILGVVQLDHITTCSNMKGVTNWCLKKKPTLSQLNNIQNKVGVGTVCVTNPDIGLSYTTHGYCYGSCSLGSVVNPQPDAI